MIPKTLKQKWDTFGRYPETWGILKLWAAGNNKVLSQVLTVCNEQLLVPGCSGTAMPATCLPSLLESQFFKGTGIFAVFTDFSQHLERSQVLEKSFWKQWQWAPAWGSQAARDVLQQGTHAMAIKGTRSSKVHFHTISVFPSLLPRVLSSSETWRILPPHIPPSCWVLTVTKTCFMLPLH